MKNQDLGERPLTVLWQNYLEARQGGKYRKPKKTKLGQFAHRGRRMSGGSEDSGESIREQKHWEENLDENRALKVLVRNQGINVMEKASDGERHVDLRHHVPRGQLLAALFNKKDKTEEEAPPVAVVLPVEEAAN